MNFNFDFINKLKERFSKNEKLNQIWHSTTEKFHIGFNKIVKKSSRGGSKSSSNLFENIISTFSTFFSQQLFSTEIRNSIQRFFIIFTVITVTFFSGKIIALSINTITSPQFKVEKRSNKIFPSNLVNISNSLAKFRKDNFFKTEDQSLVPDENSKKQIVKQKPIQSINCEIDTKEKSSLPIKLLATTVLQNSSKSVATIEGKDKEKIKFLRENDNLGNDARIEIIAENKIIIKNLKNNSCEFVENKKFKESRKQLGDQYSILSPDEGKKILNNKISHGIKNVGDNFTIKKKFRDEMLGDISGILTQARAVPIKNSDGTLSYKMTEVVPGSIYTKLNIQNGDIIEAIDGNKIKTLNQVMNKFGSIKDLEHLTITVKRDGVEKVLEYNFE